MIISTKAGYWMWDGPYGDWGSKKYLVASLEQSLKRMGLEYVDIFYHHRPDPETPLEETMSALDLLVRQGKALYVGISNYGAEEAAKAISILRKLGTPCLLHQPVYSMLNRWVEKDLLSVLEQNGVGCIPYSPLAQGILTDRYVHGIPSDARASRSIFLKTENITPEIMKKVQRLTEIAKKRNQSLAQMALAWIVKDSRITSVLVGASKPEQLADSLKCMDNLQFSPDELSAIEKIFQ